jgi:hypothetical protein
MRDLAALSSLNFDDQAGMESIVLETAGALKVSARVAKNARTAPPVVTAIVGVPVHTKRRHIEELFWQDAAKRW